MSTHEGGGVMVAKRMESTAGPWYRIGSWGPGRGQSAWMLGGCCCDEAVGEWDAKKRPAKLETELALSRRKRRRSDDKELRLSVRMRVGFAAAIMDMESRCKRCFFFRRRR